MTDPTPLIDPNTLFASVDGMASALSENECMFLSAEDHEAHVMTLDVLQAMQICRPFRRFDGHVQAVQKEITSLADQPGAVRQVLQHLVTRELLQPVERVLDAVPEPSEAAASTACLVFGRDAAGLIAALDGLAELGPGEGEVLVLDGSPESARDRVEAAVARLVESGKRVRWVDRDRRRRLVENLAAATGFEADDLAGGLDSSVAGLWNTGLLLAAGRRVTCVYDSDRPDWRRRTSAGEDWSLEPVSVPPMTLVRDDGVFDQALTEAPNDVMGRILALCGSPLGEQPGGLPEQAMAGLGWADARGLARSRLLMVVAGHWGDVDSESNAWVYQTPPLALPHVAPDRDRYYRWLRRPLAASGFDRFQVTRVAPRRPVALDAGDLLPPAPTAAEDPIFAFSAWSRFVHPDSVAVSTPWMMALRKPAGFQPSAENPAPGLGRFVGEYALVRGEDCAAGPASDRMDTLAGLHRDLAAADSGRLRRMLEEFVTGYRSDQLRRMQITINGAADAPDYWRADAKSWIEHEVDQITGDGVTRLRDFHHDLGRKDCVDALREALRRQAAWLTRWPRLWSVAAERGLELIDG